MYISTDPLNRLPAQSNSPGSYEWWYFDAIDPVQDLSFVIIFYRSNPFSTRKIKESAKKNGHSRLYPALSISVYREEKPVYYSFQEFPGDEFGFDKENMQFHFGDHTFNYSERGDLSTATLQIEQELPSGLGIKCSLEYNAARLPKDLFSREMDPEHMWNLIMPRALVEGRILLSDNKKKEIIEFRGKGYHDHNRGQVPMKESFTDWYWGRFHFPEYTLIYYIMNKVEGPQYEAWLIDPDHYIRAQKLLVEKEGSLTNFFGLKSDRIIRFKGDDLQITVQAGKVVDDGPFYQRFSADAIAESQGRISVAKGLSEYIRPERIYSRTFWPLVHMRLQYTDQRPHWVQKSKFWYKLTW